MTNRRQAGYFYKLFIFNQLGLKQLSAAALKKGTGKLRVTRQEPTFAQSATTERTLERLL